jgi:two-component system sensor histidine kinase LytS
MNPHFLFNALNTLSALSSIDPRAVPGAAARLGLFLRASLDQHERPFVRLREELEVVRAYLDVESLRMGERLIVEQEIAPRLLNASVPPFLLQPLVENAVRHGIQPRPEGGLVLLTARREASWLLLTVADTGVGIPPEKQARLFRPDDGHVHALTLLRRRLQGLYGSAFALVVESDGGSGAAVSIRIPLREEDGRSEEDSVSALGTARERLESDTGVMAGRQG